MKTKENAHNYLFNLQNDHRCVRMSSQKGKNTMRKGKEKVIFIRVSDEYHEKLKFFAWKSRSDMHKYVVSAIDEYIAKKEAEEAQKEVVFAE
jgi:hypothetical protein